MNDRISRDGMRGFAVLSDDTLTVSAGQSSLTYDPATGQYTYIWKTDKS